MTTTFRAERFHWGDDAKFNWHDKAKAFDPSEPRDEQGRWTEGGGGGIEAGQSYSSIAELADEGIGDVTVGYVKGDIEKVRAEAAKTVMANGDGNFEVGIMVSRKTDKEGVKIAYAEGDKGSVGMSGDITKQFNLSEFHHNHPTAGVLSLPDLGVLNGTPGNLAVYAHFDEGKGESMAIIPGRNTVHPNRHWTATDAPKGADVFGTFTDNYYHILVGNDDVKELMSGIITEEMSNIKGSKKERDKQGNEIAIMAENYFLLSGLAGAGLVKTTFTPGPRYTELIKNHSDELEALSMIATEVAKEGKKVMKLKLRNDYGPNE
jgi:hypothetical protein